MNLNLLKNFSCGFERLQSVIFLIILSPLAVSAHRIKPSWDDTFFLHNGVCVARSFWQASFSGIDSCMSQIAKSPVMAFLMIPAGPSNSLESLSIAPFILSFIISGLILLLYHLLRSANVPFIAMVLAAFSAVSVPSIWTSAAPFMVDGLLAVIVACTITLVFVEFEDRDVSDAGALTRGALWAFIVTVGILSKTTYAVIVLLVAPIAIWVSLARTGTRTTLLKVSSLIFFLLPVIFVLIRYGSIYLAHAKNSSFGPLSSFYDDGQSPYKFLLGVLTVNWTLWVGIAAIMVIALLQKVERKRATAAFLVALVIVIYLFISSTSPNKDPRFFWLVWVALPFCAAFTVRASSNLGCYRPLMPAIQVIAALVISLPAIGRLDLEQLRTSVLALEKIPANTSSTVVIATDSAHFNIETMLLAQQLNWNEYSGVQIRTVVYDVVSEGSTEKSLQRLSGADFVLGQFPVPGDAPAWANKYASEFEQHLLNERNSVEVLGVDQSVKIFTNR